MKALVTGGSGYFGETLLDQLIDQGYECSVLDINPLDKKFANKVRFFKADIRDFDKVLEATKNIDCVFHNVAQVPLAKDKELFDSVNNIGTKNILEASKLSGCNQLVYTSSSAIYGIPHSNPVNEQTTPNPVEEYGRAKLQGENQCFLYEDEMIITIIRPRTILGKGRLGIFQILFEWIYSGQNIPVFDSGANIYQFVHCEDLADACVKAFQNKARGSFNIGTEDYCSLNETLTSLIKHSKKDTKIRSLPSKLIIPLMKIASFLRLSPLGPYHAAMYGKSLFFDSSKARNELGWNSRYSNEEMMIESYDWYLKNREAILKHSSNKSHHKSKVKQGILFFIGKFL